MGQDDSGDDERRARYAALSSQPVRKARPTCAICMVPVEEFYECEDAGLDRVIFIAVCHGARERVVVEGNLTVRDLGLAFVPEGPPALPPHDARPCLLWSRDLVIVPPSLWEQLVRECGCSDCDARLEAHARTGSWRLEKDGPPATFTMDKITLEGPAEVTIQHAGHNSARRSQSDWPEGPPALPAPPTHALPPHEEDLRDRPAASFCSEGPYREEDGTLSPYERCGAEYWYPSSFGMTLPWKGRCERRKGHASGPAPRYGHSGAEKT